MFNLRGQPSEWSPQPCVLRYAPLRCQCQQTLPEIDGNHSQQPQDDAISSWSAVKKEEHNWIAGFKWTDFLHRCNQLLSLSFQIRKFRWVNQPQIIGHWDGLPGIGEIPFIVKRFRVTLWVDDIHVPKCVLRNKIPCSWNHTIWQLSVTTEIYIYIYILYIAIYHPYITIIYPSH